MHPEKRGQVTIFVAIGIVLVAVLVIAIGFRGQITEIVTKQGTETQTGFQSQVDEVRSHIEGCLSNSLKESIFLLSTKKVGDYNQELANEVTLRAGLCLNLESFSGLTVKKLAEPKIEIFRNSGDTTITATMIMPIRIEQEENSEQLEKPFFKSSITILV